MLLSLTVGFPKTKKIFTAVKFYRRHTVSSDFISIYVKQEILVLRTTNFSPSLLNFYLDHETM